MAFTMIVAGILTLLAACGVVFLSKPLHSALSLVVTLFLVAVHFALLDAAFIAALQVLIYAGAIMVLVIFVIMLLGPEQEVERPHLRFTTTLSLLITSGFVGLLLYATQYSEQWGNSLFAAKITTANEKLGSAEAIGYSLFTNYLYAFEITGVLLFAAIIAAVTLAHYSKHPLAQGRGLKAMRHDS